MAILYKLWHSHIAVPSVRLSVVKVAIKILTQSIYQNEFRIRKLACGRRLRYDISCQLNIEWD